MTTDADVTCLLEAEWCRRLNVAEARDGDNFFDLGGDSLSAIRMVKAIEEAVGVTLPLAEFFLDGTLSGLKSAGWARTAY